MPRPKRKVEKALLDKGFVLDERDHHYFIYFNSQGKKTPVKTKTSLSKKAKDISDQLLSRMAKQCQLDNNDFRDLVDCPLDRNGYEQRLIAQGAI